MFSVQVLAKTLQEWSGQFGQAGGGRRRILAASRSPASQEGKGLEGLPFCRIIVTSPGTFVLERLDGHSIHPDGSELLQGRKKETKNRDLAH